MIQEGRALAVFTATFPLPLNGRLGTTPLNSLVICVVRELSRCFLSRDASHHLRGCGCWCVFSLFYALRLSGAMRRDRAALFLMNELLQCDAPLRIGCEFRRCFPPAIVKRNFWKQKQRRVRNRRQFSTTLVRRHFSASGYAVCDQLLNEISIFVVYPQLLSREASAGRPSYQLKAYQSSLFIPLYEKFAAMATTELRIFCERANRNRLTLIPLCTKSWW